MKLPTEERKQIENEMLFRRANEAVGDGLDELDKLHKADGNHHLVRNDDMLLNFKCECSDENCDVRVPMRLSHYRKLHLDRSSFIIKPNHEVKPIETVIEVAETYSVVRKIHTTREPRLNARFHKTGLNNSKK